MKHNWEYKRLGDVATYVNGYAFKPTDWIESGYPIIRIQNLNNSDAIYNYSNGNIPSKYFVSDGDLLISWSASLGAYIWHGEKAVLNQHIFKVIFDKTDIIKNYLKYFVDFSLPLMASKTHGATMRHITKPSFDALPIPFPKLEVQEQIVAELDKINETIEDCRELLHNLDALAQSLFYDFFGDPVINPKGWTLKPWSDCINIINGKNQKAVENPNGQFPIYGSGGIMSYADAYLCPEYCTIIGRKGNISKPIFVKTKFWNVDTAFGLCPDKSILAPLYLYFFCKNYDFEKHNKAVTIPSLVKGDLLKIQIPVPPLELQEKFAERIEQIEAQKKTVENTIAELQTLLDSRMDYWFN